MLAACYAIGLAAAEGLPAQSGRMLGALQRDAQGNIVVVPGGPEQAEPGAAGTGTGNDNTGAGQAGQSAGLAPPPSQRPAPRATPGPGNSLLSLRGFIHRQEAARNRRQVLDAMNREARRKQAGAPTDRRGLTAGQVQLIVWLRDRDREVRRHENAHYYGGQPYTERPVFDLITGPDGRPYAISGSVRFRLTSDDAAAGDYLLKLRRLHMAALAPTKPSRLDRHIADALAAAMRRAHAGRSAR